MKTSDRALTRLCLRLWTSDIEFINKLCIETNREFNMVAREMIATVVRQMKAKERRNIDQIEPPAIPSESVREILEIQ